MTNVDIHRVENIKIVDRELKIKDRESEKGSGTFFIRKLLVTYNNGTETDITLFSDDKQNLSIRC